MRKSFGTVYLKLYVSKQTSPPLFFNPHIRDLLVNSFIQWSCSSSLAPAEKQPTEKEILVIQEAERIISKDISKHINVAELAKRVHMNEFRFKVVFNQIFHTGA